MTEPTDCEPTAEEIQEVEDLKEQIKAVHKKHEDLQKRYSKLTGRRYFCF